MQYKNRPTIKILCPEEAKKIAAGEVINRPVDIVKELFENALDARATKISVSCDQGGKEYIQVVDNGIGMCREDARACILPHATSKLSSITELQTIQTFGFRGEALASVATISFVELVTRTEHDDIATVINIEGGKIVAESVKSASKGTTFTVKNLFYNLPARKKFLKKDNSEWQPIYQLVTAYAIAHPHLDINLYHNNKNILNIIPVSYMYDRAQQLFSSDIIDLFVPVEKEWHGIIISGYISTRQKYKHDRTGIYLYVNNRWIKNSRLLSVVVRSYQHILEHGQYPYAALSITLPASDIDVNVHPRKEEVLFVAADLVEGLLYKTIQETLQNALTPSIKPSFTVKNMQKVSDISSQYFFQHTQAPVSTFLEKNIASAPLMSVQNNNMVPVSSETSSLQTVLMPREIEETTFSYVIVGQVRQTYIIIEQSDGVWLLDQHAVHERILYESFVENFQQVEMHKLAFPMIIKLSKMDYEHAQSFLPIFEKYGIGAELWDDSALLISSVPPFVLPHKIVDIITSMMSDIDEVQVIATNKDAEKKMIAMIACKAAIKAGDKLSYLQIEELLKKFTHTENRFSCPHGRPTTWKVRWHEIEKMFKRT